MGELASMVTMTPSVIMKEKLILYFPQNMHNEHSIVGFNSLAPGWFKVNFRWVIFKLIFSGKWLRYLLWKCPHASVTGPYLWLSTLVQVMAWCRQATSRYLSQCWPRSLSPYGVTRPQWVKSSLPQQNGCHFADDIFRCIFVNWKFCILIVIWLKFIPEGLIDNNPGLV